LLTGWSQISKGTGLTRQEIRARLELLKNLEILTIKTTNRFSIITICNYDHYQDSIVERQPTDKPPSNQQATTNKNDKNEKNNNGRSRKETDPRVKEFLTYWEETFKRETGQPYTFSFGKEGKLIKDLLSVHDLPTLQNVTKTFFKDEQCKRRGLTIGIFFQEINRLLSLKIMNPLEQAKRELGWKEG
jgi:hypothetical protein